MHYTRPRQPLSTGLYSKSQFTEWTLDRRIRGCYPAAVRAAIVHDWLTGMRGGERVLESLLDLLPGAEIFTLFCFPDRISPRIRACAIHTSFLQRMPFARRAYRSYLPLFPLAVESFDLDGFDLVVSSSHCVAKGVITRTDTVHVSYVHTPMRYLWDARADYLGNGRLGPLLRPAASAALLALRRWDEGSGLRPDYLVANSRTVAARIRKRYRREADVIPPPVETDRFQPSGKPPGEFYLCVSALVPYKRLDIAVRACTEAHLSLEVVGEGPERSALERMAGPTIRFRGRISDEELAALYAQCRALLFPGEEDFGITPLEAMAAGRPVVAYGRGGVTETVVDAYGPASPGASPTGVLFPAQTPADLVSAIRRLESQRDRGAFDPAALRRHALAFDRRLFAVRFRAFLAERAGVTI